MPRALEAQIVSIGVDAPVLGEVPAQVGAEAAEERRRGLVPAVCGDDHLPDGDERFAHAVNSFARRDVGRLDEKERLAWMMVADRGDDQADWDVRLGRAVELDVTLPPHDLSASELAERVLDVLPIGLRDDVGQVRVHQLVAPVPKHPHQPLVDLHPVAVG